MASEELIRAYAAPQGQASLNPKHGLSFLGAKLRVRMGGGAEEGQGALLSVRRSALVQSVEASWAGHMGAGPGLQLGLVSAELGRFLQTAAV